MPTDKRVSDVVMKLRAFDEGLRGAIRAATVGSLAAMLLYGCIWAFCSYCGRFWPGLIYLFALAYVLFGAFAIVGWNPFLKTADEAREQSISYRAHKVESARVRSRVRVVLFQRSQWRVSLVVIAAFCFLFSSVEWNRHDPSIFAGARASTVQVGLFVLDLSLRGLAFDVMEHFKLDLSPVSLSFDRYLYVMYSFSFRSFVSLVVISLIVRTTRTMIELSDPSASARR